MKYQCHLFSRFSLFLAGVLAFSAAAPVLAQTPSAANLEAQELLRQQERERVLRQQQEHTPDVRLPRPAEAEAVRLPADESPCFPIGRIELQGDLAERFQWAVAAANPEDDPALGRCLGAEGINLVMKRIQNAIVGQGFVTTRVLAQPQDLRTGTLVLTVVPGRVRAARLAEGAESRAGLWNGLPARSGDLLNLRDIEQGLENFKRVPTAEADIQIVPADGDTAQPGESDLQITYRQAFPFRLSLTADDAGSRATGKYQGSTTVSYDNWWTLNDLFYFTVSQSITPADPGNKGTLGYTGHYSIPYGYWLLGFTAGHNRYHQAVAGANQTYVYSGESDNAEVKLSRLVYRDAVRKTTLWVSGWTRGSKNYIDDTEVLVQRRRMAGWAAGMGHREFLGAATLDANLNYKRGTGADGSLKAPEENFGEGTSRPRLVTADLQLNWPFALEGQSFRYLGVWRGQWNDTPLVPQDRFSIGGRYTVRGFDGETTLSAERGWLVRNDLAIVLQGQELYLGADYGEVNGPSAGKLAGKYLGGAVIGLRGSVAGVGYDLFVGQPTKRPEHFKAPPNAAGFSLSMQF